MKLTPEIIRDTPTPTSGAKKLTDGRGLFLLLQSRGRPTWRLKYSFVGCESSISLGPYPDVTIEAARIAADAARAMLRENPPRDPAEVRRRAAEAQHLARVTTFGTVGREYLALDDSKSKRTADKHAWLHGLLEPLHKRPIASIEAPDVLRVVRAIEAQGKREAAHRCAQFAARVFRYAIQTGALAGKVNPAADLRGALKPVKGGNHPAITDPQTFGLLMKVLDSTVDNLGYASVTYAMQLIARVALRGEELRLATWAEINFERSEWRVPAERMKMKREHVVPLSRQCMEILRSLHKITGEGALVFEGQRHGATLSDTAMRKRLQMIFPPDLHSLHGFRSTFSTLMHERGYDSELIELQLSHAKRGAVRSVYDKSQRIPERRKLMQDWSDYIDELRGFARTWA